MKRPWFAATAEKHKAADEACGRRWQCFCGACRSAKAVIAKRRSTKEGYINKLPRKQKIESRKINDLGNE